MRVATGTGARSARGAALLLGLLILATAPRAADITLTHDQLQRLVRVVEQRGSRALIPAGVAALLGLAPKQVAPDIKQAAYQDAEGNRHGFGPLNDGSGYFMFRSGTAFGQSVFRVDAQLRLVRAARTLRSNGPLIELPPTEARKELDDEFARWSRVLSPNGMAPLPFPFKRPQSPTASPLPTPSRS